MRHKRLRRLQRRFDERLWQLSKKRKRAHQSAVAKAVGRKLPLPAPEISTQR